MQKTFTKRYLDGLHWAGERIEVKDCGQGAVSGLNFRVTPSGKTWFIRFRSPTEKTKTGEKVGRKKTIGNYLTMDIPAARKKALEIMSQVQAGIDPYHVEEVDPASILTVSDVFYGAYTTFHLSTLSDRYRNEVERQWKVEIHPSIGSKPIAEVTERQVANIWIKKEITAPVMASRIHMTLKHFFSWARSSGRIDNNPIVELKYANNSKPCERFLAEDEIEFFFQKLPDSNLSSPRQLILLLLLLTGQRSAEVSATTESELDFDKMVWNIPKERTKNKRPHTIPLTEKTAGLFKRAIELGRAVKGNDQGYVFPSVSKFNKNKISGPVVSSSTSNAVKRTVLAMGMEKWTPHDLRRSLSTHMNELGIQPHIVEYIINHTSGSRAGVAGVYNRALPLDEMKRALERWESHVMYLIEGKPVANVVKLRG